MPEISILLPTYSRNSGGLLAQAIESVLAQTYRDFELFVVDDGSTDGSSDTIARFCSNDTRVKHIRFEKNTGLPALTTAEAFAQSSGKYIAWQFDDCKWRPELLSSLLNRIQQTGAGVAYGKTEMTKRSGATTTLGQEFDREFLLAENFIGNCSTLTKRDVFDRCGWFDPHISVKRICDYDMWLRASLAYKFAFLDEVVAEEHGEALPDSLGNSVFLSKELARAHMNLDRADHLNVKNRSNWDPFARSENLDGSLEEDFFYIVVQHAVATSNIDLAVKKLARYNSNFSTADAVLKWYAKMINRRTLSSFVELDKYVNRLEHEMSEKQKYITHLEETQGHLHQRIVDLQETEKNLRERMSSKIIRWVGRRLNSNK